MRMHAYVLYGGRSDLFFLIVNTSNCVCEFFSIMMRTKVWKFQWKFIGNLEFLAYLIKWFFIHLKENRRIHLVWNFWLTIEHVTIGFIDKNSLFICFVTITIIMKNAHKSTYIRHFYVFFLFVMRTLSETFESYYTSEVLHIEKCYQNLN